MVADGERPYLKTICRLKTEGGSLSSLPSDGISNAAFAPYAGCGRIRLARANRARGGYAV
ncbi:hypothetical protein [Neisseria lactamica]|uniref:hypothetical protein n=1 Tax=Neisseria lactamica TaxID=486 RepID=UPI0027E097BA|nr:hypothetical protein [Neisseria lactamica]